MESDIIRESEIDKLLLYRDKVIVTHLWPSRPQLECAGLKESGKISGCPDDAKIPSALCTNQGLSDDQSLIWKCEGDFPNRFRLSEVLIKNFFFGISFNFPYKIDKY